MLLLFPFFPFFLMGPVAVNGQPTAATRNGNVPPVTIPALPPTLTTASVATFGTTPRPTTQPTTTATTTMATAAGTSPLSAAPSPTGPQPVTFTVGLIAPDAFPELRTLVGFGQSVPAINIALARAKSEGLIDPTQVDFSYVWYKGDCNRSTAISDVIQLVQWYKIDVLIGPPCSNGGLGVGLRQWLLVLKLWILNSASLSSFKHSPPPTLTPTLSVKRPSTPA